MGFTIIAVALGLVVGLVAGGRPSNIGRRPLRAIGALGAAVVLQALPQLIDVSGTTGLACVLGSYALLLVFAMVNVRFVGMPVVLVGLLLNIAVIGANGGMPVRADAILTVDSTQKLSSIDFGAKRHLEDPTDRLTILGDVLPVTPLGEVLSFGDVILAAGIANVVFRLLKPAAPRRKRKRPASEVIGMLPAVTMTELRKTA